MYIFSAALCKAVHGILLNYSRKTMGPNDYIPFPAFLQGDHSPDTMTFPDNSLMIRGTPDHFNWYSYHACTTGVKVNDQTVKFIFN